MPPPAAYHFTVSSTREDHECELYDGHNTEPEGNGRPLAMVAARPQEDGVTNPSLPPDPATDLYILHPYNYATVNYSQLETWMPYHASTPLNIGVVVDFHNFKKSDRLLLDNPRAQDNFVGFAAAAGGDMLHGYLTQVRIWFVDMDLKRDPHRPLDMNNRNVWGATGCQYVQVLRGDRCWRKDAYNFDPESPIGYELWTEPDDGYAFLEDLTSRIEPRPMVYHRANGSVKQVIPEDQPLRHNPFGIVACISYA